MDETQTRNRSATLGERLDSWKEIAAYLRRDIRTVQRWEKQERLPVHRHVHDERGTAYAYSGEIDEWLRNRSIRNGDAVDDAMPAGSAIIAVPDAGRRRRPVVLALAVVVVLVGTLAGFWALSRARSESPRLSSLSITFAAGERLREWGPDMALSPDGSTLVYITENGQLMIRRIDELTPRAVPGSVGSWGPFFSPDGRWIGFNRAGQLMKVSAAGGAPAELGPRARFTGAADWGADGHIVYADTTPEGTHGLYRVNSQGGAPQLIAALDANANEAYWLTPQSLSDGAVILSTLARTTAPNPRCQIVAISVATGDRRLLVDDARHAMYIGDGVLVYWRNGALFAVRLNVDRLEVTGPEVPAWNEVWERVRLRSWTAAGGTLVYWPTAHVEHRLAWVDRSGKQELLPLPPAMYHAPRISPDGRSLAYGIGHDLNSDVWKYDLATGETVRLTSGGRAAAPLWTPDGTGLIVSWSLGGGRDLAQVTLGSSAEPKLIPSPSLLTGTGRLPASWAEVGQALLVRQSGGRNQPALWTLALNGKREPQPFARQNALYGDISPDGRWITYTAPESLQGPNQVYVAPFPAGRPEWKVSNDGGALSIWAKNGRELFYRSRNAIMSVPVTLGDTFTPGTPRLLFEAPFYEGDPGSPNYDVAPDNQRFIMVFPASSAGPDRLHVIQGWKAEILRRLNTRG